MTKATIWNQLKTEYEYSSRFLNKLYGVTYQQASKELLESILEQLQKEVGGGVDESLSTEVVEVTGNKVNQDETPVNYIVTLADYPQVVIKDDYNPKDLTEVTEQQLVNSLYTDKVTAEMMFPGSYYQVLEVNPVNIRQELMQHFNLEQDSTVATDYKDNKFKGIPVQHYNFKHEVYIDSVLKDTSGVLISKYLGTHSVSLNDGEQRKSDITLLEAVKVANEWLGVNTVKVLSTEEAIQPFDYSVELAKLKAMNPNDFMQLIKFTQHVKNFSSYYVPKTEVIQSYLTISEWEQVLESTDCDAWLKVLDIENCFSEAGNYHYSQMQLTPKLELFAKFTEFTYLANCLKYLIERMLDANVENAKQLNKEAIIFKNNVFDSWFSVSEICFNYVVKVPLLTYKTRHQLTTLIAATLENKSIYA